MDVLRQFIDRFVNYAFDIGRLSFVDVLMNSLNELNSNDIEKTQFTNETCT